MPFRPDPDEGPSDADQERFGDDRARTGYCPDCNAEVFEDAEVCPRCFAFIGDQVQSSPKPRGRWSQQWKVVLVVLVSFALIACGMLAARVLFQ